MLNQPSLQRRATTAARVVVVDSRQCAVRPISLPQQALLPAAFTPGPRRHLRSGLGQPGPPLSPQRGLLPRVLDTVHPHRPQPSSASAGRPAGSSNGAATATPSHRAIPLTGWRPVPRRPATTTPPEACPVCQATFQCIDRCQRFCSDDLPQDSLGRSTQPGPGRAIVPAGPDCDTRYLAQQRCFDCNQPWRRIGLGGAAPSCDEPP